MRDFQIELLNNPSEIPSVYSKFSTWDVKWISPGVKTRCTIIHIPVFDHNSVTLYASNKIFKAYKEYILDT